MNKKIKIIFISAIVSVLMLSALVIAYANANGESADKKTVYEYALIGETYTIGSGFVGGQTPTGEKIPADAETVYLNWAQGSYILEYNSRIVNLKIYEKAPADKTEISFAVPGSVAEGRETVFPYMTVTSGIKRTDGAPEVGNYSVSAVFWYNGNRVKTIKNITDDFKFALTGSGIWVLSYEYKDIFGVTRTIDYNIMATADRIIIPSLDENYYVGGRINASQVYGYLSGKQYPASVEITDPDGNTSAVSQSYVFAQSGAYTMKATSNIDGVATQESYTINVSEGMQSFIGSSSGFTGGVLGDSYENLSNGVGTSSGLLLDMTSSNASFTYNGIVNLNNIGWNKPIISFTPNHSYGGNISKVTVTITDIYDSSNTITVQYLRNSDVTATNMTNDNTLVRVIYGSMSTAVNNYYPLTTDAVAWDTSFHSYWRSPIHTDPNKTYPAASVLHAMNFSFDTKSNRVFSYGRYQLIGWDEKTPPSGYPTGGSVTWYPIADLNDPSLAIPFKGFTTGEVYLTLSVESGRGDIMIHSIGGVSVNNIYNGYNTTDAISLKGYDKTLPAAVGVPYSLPLASNAYISALTCKVYFGDEEVSTSNNSFIPTKTGTYKVVYEGINQFGRKVTKTIQIKCIEKPDISISYDSEDIKIGDIYTVKMPTVTGYGNITYKIFVNGKEVCVGDNIRVSSDLSINIKATDMLSSKEATFNIVADKDVVEINVEFPRAAIAGSVFKFPTAHIYDHLAGKELAYEIYVDGVKQSDSITLPTSVTSLEVEYRTARGSEFFTLEVRNVNVQDGKDALILPNGSSASSNDAGTTVLVNADSATVKLPYMLSAANFDFKFIILEEKLNFDTMAVTLTDKNGCSVKIAISGLKQDAPTLYVNGVNTSAKVVKTAQVYTSGEYAGKSYYAFGIEYNDYYKAVLNSSKVQAYVEKDYDGIAFAGFDGGVYLDITPEDIDSGAEQVEYIITKVSNQFFYASAFEYGDITGPSLSTTDFLLMNNYIKDGYVLKLSGLSAFDVLKANSTVTLTLTLSNGTVKYNGASPENLEDVVLSGVGINTLKITASDGDGGTTTVTYRFIIEDESAPTIAVSGNVADTAARGDKLTLPSASAKDDSKVSLKIVVYAPNGDIKTLVESEAGVAATDLLIEMKGTYIVRYIAKDEAGNVSSEAFSIRVEG